MRLRLFTSKGEEATEPNLVSLQFEQIHLPTILVCPLREKLTLTPARLSIAWSGKIYVVATDLIRPIHRGILRPIGELDEATSARILETFKRLLAR